MDNYVKQESILDLIEKRRSKYRKAGTRNQLLYDTLRYLERNVRNIPTEEVRPVIHARWINLKYGRYECSNCHGIDEECSDYYSSHHPDEQDYCPYCGAIMDMKDS